MDSAHGSGPVADSRRHSWRAEQGSHLKALDERPRNANRLADDLDLAYQTVRHHLDVLEENDVLVSFNDDYGTVYLPSDRTRRHWDVVERIVEA